MLSFVLGKRRSWLLAATGNSSPTAVSKPSPGHVCPVASTTCTQWPKQEWLIMPSSQAPTIFLSLNINKIAPENISIGMFYRLFKPILIELNLPFFPQSVLLLFPTSCFGYSVSPRLPMQKPFLSFNHSMSSQSSSLEDSNPEVAHRSKPTLSSSGLEEGERGQGKGQSLTKAPSCFIFHQEL